MIKYLFQGDSITDVDRSYDTMAEGNGIFGFGYPLLVASDYLKNNKGKYEFVNRGISGNKIVDLYARIKADIINLKPDVMSILIGVNDVWHEFQSCNGVDEVKFEKIYSMLIEEVTEALPNIKIILLEPFVLKGRGTQEHYPEFRDGVEKRAAAVKRVAEKYNLTFVPLQKVFDEAASDGNTAYWTADGVHPTPAGHCIIKDELVKVLKNIM